MSAAAAGDATPSTSRNEIPTRRSRPAAAYRHRGPLGGSFARRLVDAARSAADGAETIRDADDRAVVPEKPEPASGGGDANGRPDSVTEFLREAERKERTARATGNRAEAAFAALRQEQFRGGATHRFFAAPVVAGGLLRAGVSAPALHGRELVAAREHVGNEGSAQVARTAGSDARLFASAPRPGRLRRDRADGQASYLAIGQSGGLRPR